MDKNSNNLKKIHIQCIRIVAIIVVMLHHSDLCLTFYRNTDNILTFSVSLLVSCICSIDVPLFMMITGALLIPKEETIETILKKRVVKIVGILVVFSFLMYGAEFLTGKIPVFALDDFFVRLMSGNIWISYWYLYEYIVILMMLPIIGSAARNLSSEQMKYFFLLGIGIKVIIPMIVFWTKWSVPFNVPIVADSIFYVIMGYYIENCISDQIFEKCSYAKMLMLMGGCVVIEAAYALIDVKLSGNLDANPFGLTAPILIVCTYFLIKKGCMQYRFNEKCNKTIVALGECVFGVYLFEHIGQKIFLPLYLFLCEKTFGVIACSIYILCILVFCFGITAILRKNKVIKKWI